MTSITGKDGLQMIGRKSDNARTYKLSGRVGHDKDQDLRSESRFITKRLFYFLGTLQSYLSLFPKSVLIFLKTAKHNLNQLDLS